MTSLMEEAIRRVAELPEGLQDVVASLVLAQIEAEGVWTNVFAEDVDLLEFVASPTIAVDEAEEPTELDFYRG